MSRIRAWLCNSQIWVTISTVLLAVFTGLLIYVAYLQNETSREEGRAWLAPLGLKQLGTFKDAGGTTEVAFIYKNVGRGPAVEISIPIFWDAITLDTYRSKEKTQAIIARLMGGKACRSFSANQDGPAIFPGQEASVVIGFNKATAEKINKGQYAFVTGCLIYNTLKETHRTKFCMILEHTLQGDWRTDRCFVHTGAD